MGGTTPVGTCAAMGGCYSLCIISDEKRGGRAYVYSASDYSGGNLWPQISSPEVYLPAGYQVKGQSMIMTGEKVITSFRRSCALYQFWD